MSDTNGSNQGSGWTVGDDPFVVHLLSNDTGYPSTWGGFQQIQADLLGDLVIGRLAIYKDVVVVDVEDSLGRPLPPVSLPMAGLPMNLQHVLRMLEIMLTAPVAEWLDYMSQGFSTMAKVIDRNVLTPDDMRRLAENDRPVVDTADL